MSQPYTPGETLAWVDSDPEGIRLYRATVLHIEPTEHGRWAVTTDRGDGTVDHTGNSGHILPLDVDIAADLYLRGEGYLIHPTLTDSHLTVERDGYEHDESLDAEYGDDLDLD